MARKKKLTSRSQSPSSSSVASPSTECAAVVDTGRQPRILGWLVLIVGGSSTWYWYRPLPQDVQESVYSTQPHSWSDQNGHKSSWLDQGIIEPTLTEVPRPGTSTTDRSSKFNDGSQLIGPSSVALVPWNDNKKDLRDVLQTEMIPMVPVDGLNRTEASTAPGPSPWLPDLKSSGTDNPSIKTGSNATNWPDVGYVPESVKQRAALKAATKITTTIPPLLETGMKSIRTIETNEPKSSESIAPLAPIVTSRVQTTEQAGRTPNYIRQPAK
jgi:hypothetical protein